MVLPLGQNPKPPRLCPGGDARSPRLGPPGLPGSATTPPVASGFRPSLSLPRAVAVGRTPKTLANREKIGSYARYTGECISRVYWPSGVTALRGESREGPYSFMVRNFAGA